MVGLPLLIMTLTALLPINVVGGLLLWVARGSRLARASVIGLLGLAWFLIGVFFSPDEPLVNPTTLWLGIGGIHSESSWRG